VLEAALFAVAVGICPETASFDGDEFVCFEIRGWVKIDGVNGCDSRIIYLAVMRTYLSRLVRSLQRR
jgi:hypothetical protein